MLIFNVNWHWRGSVRLKHPLHDMRRTQTCDWAVGKNIEH
jgi:hypothetical protein